MGHAAEEKNSVLSYLPGEDRGVVEGAIRGRSVEWSPSAGAFFRALEAAPRGITLVRLAEGEGDGLDDAAVRRVAEHPHAGVLFLLAGEHSVERILFTEEVGAAALLPLPLRPEELRREITPILDERGEVEIPPGPSSGEAEPIVGSSSSLLGVLREVARIADSTATLLIAGESGTGKELVARLLHQRSRRGSGPFVAVNCAAIPDTLLEAELFGHEKGAFTGAIGRSEGRFGRAHGGTLFLDEVGETSLALQAKLLRVLETGEVERLGAAGEQRVDVRVVAATNRDLREEVEAGRFRADLLFRLAVVEVSLPPLRDRPEDVVPLSLHFLRHFAERYGRPVARVSREALRRLENHNWPGNVRELRNVLDRAVLMARGGVVRSGDLQLGPGSPRLSPREAKPPEGFPPSLSLKEVEERHIRRVLDHTGGHMGEAAELLGIHRNTMTAKVREYGIDAVGKGGRA